MKRLSVILILFIFLLNACESGKEKLDKGPFTIKQEKGLQVLYSGRKLANGWTEHNIADDIDLSILRHIEYKNGLPTGNFKFIDQDGKIVVDGKLKRENHIFQGEIKAETFLYIGYESYEEEDMRREIENYEDDKKFGELYSIGKGLFSINLLGNLGVPHYVPISWMIDNFIVDGEISIENINGKIYSKAYYKNKKITNLESFYFNGNIKEKREYHDNGKIKSIEEYHESGNLKMKAKYNKEGVTKRYEEFEDKALEPKIFYERYYNPRFGYSVDLPVTDVLEFLPEPTNLDGMAMENEEETIYLSVSAMWNVLDWTLKEAYEEAQRENNISFKYLGKDYFIVSYIKGNKIIYEKRIYDKMNNKFISLYFKYLPSEKDFMNPIIIRMIDSISY